MKKSVQEIVDKLNKVFMEQLKECVKMDEDLKNFKSSHEIVINKLFCDDNFKPFSVSEGERNKEKFYGISIVVPIGGEITEIDQNGMCEEEHLKNSLDTLLLYNRAKKTIEFCIDYALSKKDIV